MATEEKLWEPSRQVVFRKFFEEGKLVMLEYNFPLPKGYRRIRKHMREMAIAYARNQMKTARKQDQAEKDIKAGRL